jgi:hypothetical protein
MNLNLNKLLPSAILATTLICLPMIPAFTQFTALSAEAKPGLNLGLTDNQKVLLEKIQKAAHLEIEKVLTDSQSKALLHNTKDEHKSFSVALAALNLTPEQIAKIKVIKQKETAAEDAILTPAQRKILQDYIAAHKKH